MVLVLVAVKDAIFPVPLAGREPIVVLLFVHEYLVVPTVFEVEKLISVVESPAHTTCDTIGSTCADGLTVIVKDLELPVQVTEPFVNVGVTVIFAV